MTTRCGINRQLTTAANFRDGSQENGVPVEEAVARIAAHVSNRVNDDPVPSAAAGRV